MEFIELIKHPTIDTDKKLELTFHQFNELLSELKTMEIPDHCYTYINEIIVPINSFSGTAKELKKLYKSSLSNILKKLETDLKIVTINHYRNNWMILGMAVFGIPLGIAFSRAIDNNSFLGIGIPLGMVIGLAFGSEKDKKAAREGRQLHIEINYR